CLDSYASHGRLVGGEADDMLDAAYRAWLDDEIAGKVSLLIAGTNDTVRELNLRARADKDDAGQVEAAGGSLHDGRAACVADRIVTRTNDRRLATGSGWVKNGDTWTVMRHHDDGSLTVRRIGSGGTLTLPAAYVAENVGACQVFCVSDRSLVGSFAVRGGGGWVRGGGGRVGRGLVTSWGRPGLRRVVRGRGVGPRVCVCL